MKVLLNICHTLFKTSWHINFNINIDAWIRLVESTVQKKWKRNLADFVLCSHENSTKFCKHPWIFVESREILLSSWWNFASLKWNFVLLKFHRGREFAPTKFRHSENSHPQNFTRWNFDKAKFRWQWKRVVMRPFVLRFSTKYSPVFSYYIVSKL